MTTELEAKWLDVNPDSIRESLERLGAERIYPETFMRRKVFDLDNRFDAVGGWIRVRDEGSRITMSYKQLNDRSLHGTKEVTVVVDDFDRACEFLIDIGCELKSYQETKREFWKAGDVEITIDTWPWIPTFVEIEAPDERTLTTAAEELGLAMRDALHGSVETAYQKYYEVSEEEVDGWKEITFSDVPEELKRKRR